MNVVCDQCLEAYDDEISYTFCPHTAFIDEKTKQRKDLAFELFISRKIYKVKDTEIIGPVCSIDYAGMVNIKGQPFWSAFDPNQLEEVKASEQASGV